MLKHDLSEPLLVGFAAHRAVSHEHGGVSRVDLKLVVEYVLEQVRHPAPIMHDASLDRMV